ncbi:hypothetical protein T08_3756 [Trichinella sp. T8]|nr:hypothetical protein T08_3756 [Trichinella sp. T8]
MDIYNSLLSSPFWELKSLKIIYSLFPCHTLITNNDSQLDEPCYITSLQPKVQQCNLKPKA